MVERRFDSAGARIVVEECLTGREASFFVLTDGRRALSRVSGGSQTSARWRPRSEYRWDGRVCPERHFDRTLRRASCRRRCSRSRRNAR